MNHSHEQLESWLGAYQTEGDAMVVLADSEADLFRIEEFYPNARPIGKNHSYNRSALHPVAIRLGEAFDYVLQVEGNLFRVGGAASIESVMVELMNHGYMLANSGNHRQQTFVGAAVNGTHGFGKQSTMMDMVNSKKQIGHVIHEVEIEAVVASSFMVTHCVCPLSKLTEQSENARSYAVFPYSSKDPICIVSEYEETVSKFVDGMVQGENDKRTWWRINLLRWIQRNLPWLHRSAQKVLNLAKMQTWYSITSVSDIDARYHPWPEADSGGKEGHVLYHSQRPTYQYHNLAFACKPEDTAVVITELKQLAGRKLAGFIGVRELNDKSDFEWALNFDGPRNAIDVYVYPDQKQITEMIERELRASQFDLRWHPAKSTGE